MGFRLVAFFLIASVCSAQTPAPAQSTPPDSAPPAMVTVPQGTTVPLTLVNPIKSKSTRPGETVRAVVAFPVTVGTQVAIPAGTYVEGMVTALSPRPSHAQGPSIKIHFTRLLFSNGYQAGLDAMNSDAALILPDNSDRNTIEIADMRDGAPAMGEGFAAGDGQFPPPPPTPVLPPLPQVGPSKGVIIGASVGVMVGILALSFAWAHHQANTVDYVVFDSGWQFAMVLSRPLILDALHVNEAASLPASR